MRFAALLLVAACGFTPPSDTVLLPIPNRPWAPEAPPEGWCGEVSIQMASLYYGTWITQAEAHALGKPAHVDLWETDMPTAMTGAGLQYETWGGGSEPAFFEWIVGQVRKQRPVIVAVKLLPDQHPEYEIDHLMPIVGFSPKALVFNTNLEPGQAHVPWAALEKHQVFAMTSKAKRQYGWAITGTTRPKSSPPVP